MFPVRFQSRNLKTIVISDRGSVPRPSVPSGVSRVSGVPRGPETTVGVVSKRISKHLVDFTRDQGAGARGGIGGSGWGGESIFQMPEKICMPCIRNVQSGFFFFNFQEEIKRI